MVDSLEGANGGPDSPPASIVKKLAEIIENEVANDDGPVSDAEAKATSIAHVLLSEQYQGAFPHPDSLRRFDEVVKNGAERAFALTEREQEHRHSCDRKLIDAQIEAQRAESKDRRIFLFFGASLALLALILTVVLAVLGKTIGVGVVGGSTILAAIGGGFVYRRKDRDKNS